MCRCRRPRWQPPAGALRLVGAFHKALQAGNSAGYQTALMETLQQLELDGVDLTAWQELASTLRREMTRLPAGKPQRAGTRRLAEDMLHQTRAALAESAQRQDLRHQSQREMAAHALSELAAQMGATLTQAQLANVLETRLADVGVRHARVALFEPEGDDPFGGSLLLSPDPGPRSASALAAAAFRRRGCTRPMSCSTWRWCRWCFRKSRWAMPPSTRPTWSRWP